MSAAEFGKIGPTRVGIKALADQIEEIDAALPGVEHRLKRAEASEQRAQANRWDIQRTRDALVSQREAAQEAIEMLRATLPEGAYDGISERPS